MNEDIETMNLKKHLRRRRRRSTATAGLLDKYLKPQGKGVLVEEMSRAGPGRFRDETDRI